MPTRLGKPHAVDELIGLVPPGAPVVHALEDAHVVEELGRREVGIGLDVLRQVAQGLLERAAVARLGQVAPVNKHASARGAHDAAEDAHERGLAGAIGTDEPDHAGRQVEREAVEGAGLLREVLAQVIEGDEHGSFLSVHPSATDSTAPVRALAGNGAGRRKQRHGSSQLER